MLPSPTVAGTYLMHVSLGGEGVSGSPFTVFVKPAEPEPSRCYFVRTDSRGVAWDGPPISIEGEPIQTSPSPADVHVLTGERVFCALHVIDKFGNLISQVECNARGWVTAQAKGPLSPVVCIGDWESSFGRSRAAESSSEGPCVSPNTVALACEFLRVGAYTLTVEVNGTPLPALLKVFVAPGVGHARYSVVHELSAASLEAASSAVKAFAAIGCPESPSAPIPQRYVVADERGSLVGVRKLSAVAGESVLLGFTFFDQTGVFGGNLGPNR